MTFPTYAIVLINLPTLGVMDLFNAHIDTVWARFDDVRMLSNTMRFTPASEFKTYFNSSTL